ncbi:hypothetical protein GCM10010244_39230 [Streptomyces coeruleorubidus]|nr:hypothetical protein GCM10010244_39230 [Streptomyces bellus]
MGVESHDESSSLSWRRLVSRARGTWGVRNVPAEGTAIGLAVPLSRTSTRARTGNVTGHLGLREVAPLPGVIARDPETR